jgi:hypothetical protein
MARVGWLLLSVRKIGNKHFLRPSNISQAASDVRELRAGEIDVAALNVGAGEADAQLVADVEAL